MSGPLSVINITVNVQMLLLLVERLHVKKSITVTAGLRAAGCNAPDWSVSRYIVFDEKYDPFLVMRLFVKVL